MYAFLHGRIIASLVLIAVAFGGWYASKEALFDGYELQLKAQRDK